MKIEPSIGFSITPHITKLKVHPVSDFQRVEPIKFQMWIKSRLHPSHLKADNLKRWILHFHLQSSLLLVAVVPGNNIFQINTTMQNYPCRSQSEQYRKSNSFHVQASYFILHPMTLSQRNIRLINFFMTWNFSLPWMEYFRAQWVAVKCIR